MTWRLRLLAALVSLVCLAAPAFAQSPIVIRFSHVVAPDTPKGRGALKFKELAEQATAGRVRVDVYPNSQLYKDKEELEALQLGAVEMLAPSLAKFGPLGLKAFEAFDLPFLFENRHALRRVTNGPVGEALLSLLSEKGIKGLAFWDNGFKVMSANRPVAVPDDLLGLKMRIQSSKVLEAQMKALGALPQVMAFSEVYQGLSSGVVDGTENPPSNMFTQKMHEVQRFAALTRHGYLGYAVIANKRFWDGLPTDIRRALEGAIREATIYANDLAESDNAAALAAMREGGKTEFHELTPSERELWIDALAPVREQMAGRIGRNVLDAMVMAVAPGGEASGAEKLIVSREPPLIARSLLSRLIAQYDIFIWPLFAAAMLALLAITPRAVLARLEETAIALLIAAATLIIFAEITQRYAVSAVVRLARITEQGAIYEAARAAFRGLRIVDLGWAQELCIYLFIWMAKLGAAYGVRTGVHVGVDVLIEHLSAAKRRAVILFGLLSGAFFTFVIGTLGANFVWRIAETGQTSADLEAPMWLVYLAIPIGSLLMCFRFLEVAVQFISSGELPKHDPAAVAGLDHPAVTPKESAP